MWSTGRVSVDAFFASMRKKNSIEKHIYWKMYGVWWCKYWIYIELNKLMKKPRTDSNLNGEQAPRCFYKFINIFEFPFPVVLSKTFPSLLFVWINFYFWNRYKWNGLLYCQGPVQWVPSDSGERMNGTEWNLYIQSQESARPVLVSVPIIHRPYRRWAATKSISVESTMRVRAKPSIDTRRHIYHHGLVKYSFFFLLFHIIQNTSTEQKENAKFCAFLHLDFKTWCMCVL